MHRDRWVSLLPPALSEWNHSESWVSGARGTEEQPSERADEEGSPCGVRVMPNGCEETCISRSWLFYAGAFFDVDPSDDGSGCEGLLLGK